MMEFDDLVRAIRRGDQRAWNELLRRLQPKLDYYLRKERDEIPDLSQRTLLAVIEKFPEFELRENEPFIGWALGIAQYEVRRARRRRYRDAKLDERYAAARVSPSPPAGPVTRADLLRYRKWLERALWQLSTPHREAIQNELDGGDALTLAKRRGITQGHARVLKHRAYEQLRRLRQKLELPPLESSSARSTN